jgi:hypothetical protein
MRGTPLTGWYLDGRPQAGRKNFATCDPRHRRRSPPELIVHSTGKGTVDGRQERSQEIRVRLGWGHYCRRAGCCGHRASPNQQRDGSCRCEPAHAHVFPLDRRRSGPGVLRGKEGPPLERPFFSDQHRQECHPSVGNSQRRHKADVPRCLLFGRFWGQSGHQGSGSGSTRSS